MVASSLIDTSALWKIVLAGLGGGVGVVVAFALVLIGLSRVSDARGGALTRGGYALMTALGALVCVGALVVGFIAMTKK